MNKRNILKKLSAAASVVAMVIFFTVETKSRMEDRSIDSPAGSYWQMFAGISMERKYVEEAGAHYRLPIFTPDILALKGKEIKLSGYFLPYSKLDSVIIISRYPNSSCFYCGQAGIESVAMVELVNIAPKTFRTDQRLEVTGKLELNNRDVNKLAFIVTKAQVREEQN